MPFLSPKQQITQGLMEFQPHLLPSQTKCKQSEHDRH